MQTTIKVEGMTCGHCEKAVTTALKEVEGVKEVAVDLASGDVEVTYEDPATLPQMKDAIEEQGYDVAA
ncbi:copper chaperone CopZ [Halobacillus litoralis]|uniref:copper chaperone CopZ n=1 Tax=Halobacillus litoralis TaxID=45668 RepID=UPI001CD6069A|nr:copper chaperone CopZ [Halobacillus litoralis]MCA0969223.1 copper chaperone CopZ [Halobacillus litoralis]